MRYNVSVNPLNPLAQKIHRPSRKQAILFFIFTFVVVCLILAWTFFINKGTLNVEAEAPFTVKVAGKTATCEISPCKISLTPQKYIVTVAKDGFYDYVERGVAITRSENTKLSPQLNLIPSLRELGEIVLPVPEAPLSSPFLGMKSFENFPRNSQKNLFSGSGEKILVQLGREFYLYDVASRTTNKTVLAPSQNLAWAGEDIVVLKNEDGGGQTLQLIRDALKADERENIVSFKRAFGKTELLGSASGDKMLIIEKTGEGSNYYLIDITKKSRKHLEISARAGKPKWAGDYIIFEDSDEKVFVVNGENLEIIELPAVGSENVVWIPPDALIFISATKQSSDENDILGMSISEAVERAKQETFEEGGSGNYAYIVELDTAHKSFQTLLTVPRSESEIISRLTAASDGKKLYFEKGGRGFEVTLKAR